MNLPARLYFRYRLWLRILRELKGDTPKMELGLALSSVLDLIVFALLPRMALSPVVYVAGTVRSESLDVRFHVRGRSDDVYSVVPRREEDVHDVILDQLTEGDTFVDLGANIGYYTILAAKQVGTSGRVLAVEPLGDNFGILSKNIELNTLSNVQIFRAACWERPSKLRIWLRPGFYGLASLKRGDESTHEEVDATTLDSLCSQLRTIKFLKIDVEGAELEVLKGGGETLKKTNYVVFEASKNRSECRELLKSASFEVTEMQFKPYMLAWKGDISGWKWSGQT